MTIDLSNYPNYLEFEREEREREEEMKIALIFIQAGIRMDSVAEWLGERRRKRYER